MHYLRRIHLIYLAIFLVVLVGLLWCGLQIIRTEAEIRRLQHTIDTFQAERKDRGGFLDKDMLVQSISPDPAEGATSSEQVVVPSPEDTTVSPVILPAHVHLTVPFTSQAPEQNWEQPWQDACEEAAILMLDAYYKGYHLSPLFARDELLKMVAWQEAWGWGGSIPITQVKDTAAWFMNQPADVFLILEKPSIIDIKTQLAAGHPLLAVGDGTVLSNPHFSGDGPPYHALLIIGYDDATGEFITNDPGTQHGKDFRYTYENLMEALHDWNRGDVSNGTPVVLVRQ